MSVPEDGGRCCLTGRVTGWQKPAVSLEVRTMSKLGKKFSCWSCATKFYDLNKPNPKCPKCGAKPEDDPKKDQPAAAPAAYGEDYGDEIDEQLEADPAAAEEDEDEEPAADDAPAADDEY